MALNNVGALWTKRNAMGEEFYSGKITVTGAVLVFKNKRKAKPNDPDFVITQPDHTDDSIPRRVVEVQGVLPHELP